MKMLVKSILAVGLLAGSAHVAIAAPPRRLLPPPPLRLPPLRSRPA
jgi:hypothetical protein